MNSFKKKKILIADDDESIRFILCHILAEEFVLIEASNGEEALSQYKSVKPDLVIMDMLMGKMSGIGASKLILEFDPAAKIMILTAHANKEFRQAAFVAGAISYMVKPFDHDLFVAEVKKLLSEEAIC